MTQTKRCHILSCSLGLALALLAATAMAQAPALTLSADEDFAVGDITPADHEVAALDQTLSSWQLTLLALTDQLPVGANIDALDDLTLSAIHFSLDADTRLGSTLFADEDVVVWDGSTFAMAWDGSANGLPAGANLDALDIVAASPLELSLSLDTDATLSVAASPTLVADEDVVHWLDGSGFTVVDFDGSAAGVGAGADLDAFSRRSAITWLVSFDTAGSAGALAFDDADLLLWNPLTTLFDASLWFDASASGVADSVNVNAAEGSPVFPTAIQRELWEAYR